MLNVINSIKEIINNNLKINYNKSSRYKHFNPSNLPAVCYEAESLTEEAQTLNQHSGDQLFQINCYYLEEAMSNNHMPDFLINVEKIIQVLRDSNNLNQSVLAFDLKVKYIDTEINTRFGVKIIITGRMK